MKRLTGSMDSSVEQVPEPGAEALGLEVARESSTTKAPDSGAETLGVEVSGEPSANKVQQRSAKSRAKKKPKKGSQQKEELAEKDEFGRDVKRLELARKGHRANRDEDSSSGDELDHLVKTSCPAEKKKKDFDRELRKVRKNMRSGMNQDELDQLDNPWLATQVSDAERKLKKEMFTSFYREQYSRLAKERKWNPVAQSQSVLDTSQYSEKQTTGLKISEGHKPMPRPPNIKTPKDFRKPVGTITAAQLQTFNCDSPRLLISIHGDLFDVSDRPDKYGRDGPYAYMSGHDISWGLVVGDDAEETLDKFYDLFKIQPPDLADRKLQGLISWWCFYEKEYGSPVGRLEAYNKEWGLPPPPADQLEGCCVM